MNRKIRGKAENGNVFFPVTFLPGYRVAYAQGMLRIFKDPVLTGTPWPGTARRRRLVQGIEENNMELMEKVLPPIVPQREKSEKALLEISAVFSGTLQWEFEFEAGTMKLCDGRGFEIIFAGDRHNEEFFLFRGKGLLEARTEKGRFSLESGNAVFSCSPRGGVRQETAETWELLLQKKHGWWHEIFLKILALPPLEEERRMELLTAVHQMLMSPESTFFFDGNFSWWCQAARKLKFFDLLKIRFLRICRLSAVWQYHGKIFAGIDDGLRLPRRSDLKGNPLELDWLGALDSSFSALCAMEMFEYCNDAQDMAFLKDHAFPFMKGVMQVIELSLTPENYGLQLPYSPLSGKSGDSLKSQGKNSDRQLFYIHKLADCLIKAAELLQLRADPVWHDISARLPRARGTWQLAPDTDWGNAAKKVCGIQFLK